MLPVSALTALTLASLETIARRSLLIARNECSPAEYGRMLEEKAAAAMESTVILALSAGQAPLGTLLAPWRKRAAANAKRLRAGQRPKKTG